MDVNANLGRVYDFYFNYDAPRLFCSKFVYDLIKQSTGIEVGKVQTLGEIDVVNPQGTTFWEYWFFRQCAWNNAQLRRRNMYEDAYDRQ